MPVAVAPERPKGKERERTLGDIIRATVSAYSRIRSRIVSSDINGHRNGTTSIITEVIAKLEARHGLCGEKESLQL